MNLQEFAWIGGLVGSAAMVVSVIFGSIQIRNNTRAIRAAAFQQMAMALSSPADELARNAEFCGLILRGADDFNGLERLDKARFRFYQQGLLRRVESALMQNKLGTLHKEHLLGARDILTAVYSSQGQRDAWALIRTRFNPEFRTYVDEVVRKAAAEVLAKDLVPTPVA